MKEKKKKKGKNYIFKNFSFEKIYKENQNLKQKYNSIIIHFSIHKVVRLILIRIKIRLKKKFTFFQN